MASLPWMSRLSTCNSSVCQNVTFYVHHCSFSCDIVGNLLLQRSQTCILLSMWELSCRKNSWWLDEIRSQKLHGYIFNRASSAISLCSFRKWYFLPPIHLNFLLQWSHLYCILSWYRSRCIRNLCAILNVIP